VNDATLACGFLSVEISDDKWFNCVFQVEWVPKRAWAAKANQEKVYIWAREN
jgi:hypothetical protein